MEYVQGKSLGAIIQEKGTLPFDKITQLAIDILKGLSSLHANGFVHGDLHGNNAIVTDFDQARTKIIDFQHSVKKGSSGKARAIRRIPKPHLMLAPESKIGIIDDRYDIYGVGYMCACMSAGTKLDARPKPDPLDVETHAFFKMVRKAMHKNPEKRYPSADAMLQALYRLSDEIKRQKTGSIHLSIKRPLYI